MKSDLNKLNLLDKCIDGNVDNLHELLDVAFDHFDAFYRICKDQVGAGNIADVEYKGIDDRRAKFHIICIDEKTDTNLLITEGKVVSDAVSVERTDDGISINISLREE